MHERDRKSRAKASSNKLSTSAVKIAFRCLTYLTATTFPVEFHVIPVITNPANPFPAVFDEVLAPNGDRSSRARVTLVSSSMSSA
jgi:hypothetical protein